MKHTPGTQTAEFSRRLLHGGVRSAHQQAEGLIKEGLKQRSLYLNLLAPAAEALGEQWMVDQLDFLTVNVATSRIQTIIRTTASLFPARQRQAARAAVFASVPGEAHTIGIQMAAELHRSKGWNVDLMCHRTHEELVAALTKSPSPIAALSIGSHGSMHPLYNLVKSLRANRPDLRILISGGEVRRGRDALKALGVDAIASTYQQAERKLNQLAADIETEGPRRA